MEVSVSDSAGEIAKDVAAVGRIAAVPTLLRVLCETTGMGFAAVARVSDGSWTACAVHDEIGFGLVPGGQLDVDTTLCKEARSARTPVVIDHANADPRYRNHPTPRLYAIESYVSVPIVLGDGSYFGNLCAVDPRPAKVSEPRLTSMFLRFAALIGQQLDDERRQEETQAALLDERAAGELREELIAVLGHDLRNPLSAISTCSQLLERKAKDPDTTALASRITANTRRMSRLIDDIVDFARGRLGGELELSFAAVADLEKAFAAAVAEVADAHSGRRIDSRVEIGREVWCDRARLQQLVSNLLGSALARGTPDGTIELSSRIADDTLVIEVRGDGAPIPQASLGHLFEPFSSHSVPGRRDMPALGLYICERIVAAHGGRIEAGATPEGAVRFTARLPLGGPLR